MLQPEKAVCDDASTKRCGSATQRPACCPSRPILVHAAASLSAIAGLLPGRAWAHVKWFAPYDVSSSPIPITEVITPHFLLVLTAFALLVFGGFLLDRLAARVSVRNMMQYENAEEHLLRAGLGAFFMALFAVGETILTPELRTTAGWVPWLQFGIAASMLSTRSCALGGIGILALYCFGIVEYGVFHLTDYSMFLGLAAYMGLTSSASERLRAVRMPILCVTVCGSLMWASIEKWVYPQWTFPILEARPYLTLGVPPDDFMVVAGFVEFALAFYILTGFGLLRLGVFALAAIFVAAIADFGRTDAIGHMPTITSLVAIFLHGPTPLHHWLHAAKRGILIEAGKVTVSFTTAIIVFFVVYYGMQHAEYGNAAVSHAQATFATPVKIR